MRLNTLAGFSKAKAWMNERKAELSSRLRRYLRGYLPTYVNGSLGPVQHWFLEHWVERDETMRDELNQLRTLRSVIHGQTPLDPDPAVFSRIVSSTQSVDVIRSRIWRPTLIWLPIVTLLALSAVLLWRALPPGLEIAWSLEGETPASFRVYRASVESSEDVDFTLIGELPAEAGVIDYGYTDLHLIPGQQFIYQVEAVDGSGQLATSQIVPGNSLEALPRQMLFIFVFAVLVFGMLSMLRQFRSVSWKSGRIVI